MIIRYTDGSYAHGVIHRLVGGTIRAAVAGVEDAIEYTLIRGAWTSDNGIVVTFEFPFESEMALLPIMPAMRFIERQAHCAAGGDCVLRRMSTSSGNEPVN
jgi:hypothetical protein